jgi:DNA-binding transcriptional LysR family regulator
MILQHLITFCRVVETGGFSRAGQLVGMSQPAVTRQVAALEAELNQHLLDRSARQFRLTPSGELVFERARRIVAQVQELKEAVADLGSPEKGHLSVGAVTSVGLGLLPSILSDFAVRYPAVRVLVKASRTQEILAKLLEGEIDMAVLTNPVTHPRLNCIPLQQDRVVLIASPSMRETLPDPLPLEQLSLLEMISFQAPSRFRTFVDSILEQYGIYPNVTMEFDSHEAVKLMVGLGFGVALVPFSAVRAEIAEGRLCEVTVQGLPAINRTSCLALRKESDRQNPAADNLAAMIVTHFGAKALEVK